MLEHLESRRLYSNGIGHYGPLTIDGTSGPDTILLTQSGDTLTVNFNGTVSTYSLFSIIPGSTPGTSMGENVVTSIVVDGRAGNDVIKGDDSIQKIMVIYGGAGDDSLVGGFRKDTIYGGANLTAGAPAEYGHDTLEGGWDNDKLHASKYAACVLRGGFGADTCTGGDGDDCLYGGHGNDSIVAMNGNDSLWGEVGNDTLNGSAGNDKLYGGDNDDSFNGSSGNDSIWGDAGYDYMSAESGADVYHGGADTDTISYESRTSRQTLSEDGIANDGSMAGDNKENDNIDSDIEQIKGGAHGNTITGGPGANKIWGGIGEDIIRAGGGNDIVYGQGGADRIWGDGGDDMLDGGGGKDSLWGGAGDDTCHGGDDDDTLVAVGGGSSDKLYGEGGSDGFWLDNASTETHDANSSESNAGHVHRINGFMFGTSKEAVGQNLPDPDADKNPEGAAASYDPNRHRYDDNPLFDVVPQMNDIQQGSLGDCYFLSGLGAIALKKPDVIRQSIVDLGDHTFAVRFYRDGQPEYYRIDNELPARATMDLATYTLSYDGNAYARLGSNGSMWAPLMEKAYVFYECGSDAQYGVIEGGFGDYAFKALNISYWDKDTDDDDAASIIADALANGRAVTVATSFSLNGYEVGDSIVLNHCYTVVSVNSNGTITLRNPWGTDAGTKAGSWVQGANDGYVTFTWQSFVDNTAKFYVGNV